MPKERMCNMEHVQATLAAFYKAMESKDYAKADALALEYRNMWKSHAKPVSESATKALGAQEAKPKRWICPKCGSTLVLRNGRYGPFIGCMGYPACKYTRNAPAVGLERTTIG